MKSFIFFALLSGFFASAAAIESAPSNSNAQTEDFPKKAEATVASYFQCVKAYALRFVKTTVAPADIGDAAVSACQEQNGQISFIASASMGSPSRGEAIAEAMRRNARDFAVRSVLEARFPDK